MLRDKNDSLIISYITLRRLIGILGILLPFICIVGGLIFSKSGIQDSISNYYYTNMRDFFIGLMFCISVFLFTYNGYDKIDRIVTILSGIPGLGIAFFPCLYELNNDQAVGIFNLSPGTSNIIHYICAAIFFISLASMSLFLFTLSDKTIKTKNKLKRNIVYNVCGIIIFLSLILLGILLLFDRDYVSQYKLELVFEIIMLFAFGISWLVKGETMLKDKTV